MSLLKGVSIFVLLLSVSACAIQQKGSMAQAHKAYDRGDCARALNELSDLEQRKKKSAHVQAEILYLRAQCLEKLAQTSEALDLYEHIVRTFPNSTYALQARVKLLEHKIAGEKPETPLSSAPPTAIRVDRRLALVIGNSEYRQAGRLPNPINDATDVASALKPLGFQVTLMRNAKRQDMEDAVKNLSRELRSGGVGLFYFAGHGAQVEGQNFLIPVDISLERESDVKYSAIQMNWILEMMKDAGNGFNIVIFDACRNNPFARSWRASLRGLAMVQAARGSLIAYATSPDALAKDGKGRNSPYTRALVKYMKQPGLSVEQMFKQVRIEVEHETNGQQTPWELSSLTGDFYFAEK